MVKDRNRVCYRRNDGRDMYAYNVLEKISTS